MALATSVDRLAENLIMRPSSTGECLIRIVPIRSELAMKTRRFANDSTR
jgi:hypothetical protein